MYLSEGKGYQAGQVSAGDPKKESFCHILIPFHLLMQKYLK